MNEQTNKIHSTGAVKYKYFWLYRPKGKAESVLSVSVAATRWPHRVETATDNTAENPVTVAPIQVRLWKLTFHA